MKDNARLTTSLLAFLLMWSALLLVRPPAASAVPGRITDDTFTVDGSGTNFGIAGVLRVVDAANPQKTWLKFDLSALTSALPPVTAADVEKATLTIFLDGVGANGSVDVDEATSPWDEGTITGTSQPTVGATDATFSMTTADARKRGRDASRCTGYATTARSATRRFTGSRRSSTGRSSTLPRPGRSSRS